MSFYPSTIKRLVFALLIVLISSTPAISAVYYVDGTNGNDAADGSSQSPWKTIATALKHAKGTDTIYIRYATYNEAINMGMIPLRGVSLIGIPKDGKRPVIVSPSPKTQAILLVNYTGVIRSLEITGASSANGINCLANKGDNTGEIADCVIHGNDIGVHITTVGDATGITCAPYVHNNYIYSNTSRGIGNMGYSSAIIEGNIIYGNGTGGQGNGGIGVRDHSSPIIINNIISRNDHTGISIRDFANPQIINNTIYGHRSSSFLAAGIRYWLNTDATITVVNNIITDNETGMVSRFNKVYPGNDYNNVWNNSFSDYEGITKGSHDLAQDPLFVDPENGDFHLQGGSPCIDVALASSAPAQDLTGTIRPQGSGVDMGALEFTTTPVPQPPELTLSVEGLTATADWTGVSGATSYKLIYWSADRSSSGEIEVGDATSFSAELWQGAAYFVAIKACNQSGCGTLSNIEYFEIP